MQTRKFKKTSTENIKKKLREQCSNRGIEKATERNREITKKIQMEMD